MNFNNHYLLLTRFDKFSLYYFVYFLRMRYNIEPTCQEAEQREVSIRGEQCSLALRSGIIVVHEV